VSPAAARGKQTTIQNNVRNFGSLPDVRFTGAHSSKAARALHLAAFDTNCRTGSGSIHRLDNEYGRILFRCPPRTTAGAWTWRRQVLACAIINDATPKKIAAVKVTISKGSQVCTYSSI
jgi:hypothetical protein